MRGAQKTTFVTTSSQDKRKTKVVMLPGVTGNPTNLNFFYQTLSERFNDARFEQVTLTQALPDEVTRSIDAMLYEPQVGPWWIQTIALDEYSPPPEDVYMRDENEESEHDSYLTVRTNLDINLPNDWDPQYLYEAINKACYDEKGVYDEKAIPDFNNLTTKVIKAQKLSSKAWWVVYSFSALLVPYLMKQRAKDAFIIIDQPPLDVLLKRLNNPNNLDESIEHIAFMLFKIAHAAGLDQAVSLPAAAFAELKRKLQNTEDKRPLAQQLGDITVLQFLLQNIVRRQTIKLANLHLILDFLNDTSRSSEDRLSGAFFSVYILLFTSVMHIHRMLVTNPADVPQLSDAEYQKITVLATSSSCKKYGKNLGWKDNVAVFIIEDTDHFQILNNLDALNCVSRTLETEHMPLCYTASPSPLIRSLSGAKPSYPGIFGPPPIQFSEGDDTSPETMRSHVGGGSQPMSPVADFGERTDLSQDQLTPPDAPDNADSEVGSPQPGSR